MPVDSQILERVRDEARRRGVRWTSQRQTILELLANRDDHITAEELHRIVSDQDRTVSPATVYRTVNMLVEMGVVSKRNFGASSASFEWNLTKQHHDHLVCIRCGEILEFENERIEVLQEEIAATYGFSLSHHRLDLYGTCPKCRKKSAK